jgi:hypothetical protein
MLEDTNKKSGNFFEKISENRMNKGFYDLGDPEKWEQISILKKVRANPF